STRAILRAHSSTKRRTRRNCCGTTSWALGTNSRSTCRIPDTIRPTLVAISGPQARKTRNRNPGRAVAHGSCHAGSAATLRIWTVGPVALQRRRRYLLQSSACLVKNERRSARTMMSVRAGGSSLHTLRSYRMKIVVIGGTGLIGSKLVALLRRRDQEVLAASPDRGVNTLTGEGLPTALAGTQVVVDVANSPSFEDSAVMTFFQTSGRNLLAAEAAAGVPHHVALSIVGEDRLPSSGYMRDKGAQETLIKAARVPYTILRSTQFFEFGGRIADEYSDGNTVRVPGAGLIQPILSDDVVSVL